MKSIYLAPLQGITDHIFRSELSNLYKGYTKAFSPFFLADTTATFPESSIIRKLGDNDQNYKLIPQVISKNGLLMSIFAQKIGAIGFDEININMGCPFPTVTRKGRGSALLEKPDVVDTLLADYFKTKTLQLSVKMRLGVHSPRDIFKLIEILNDYPLKEIIIHPRTADQQYTGETDFNTFLEIANKTEHKLCYNGDITSYQSFIQINSNVPENVEAIMIGRGLVHNPFLIEEIIKGGELTIEEKKNRVYTFFKKMSQRYGETLEGDGHYLQKMKSLTKYFLPQFCDSPKPMKKILKTKSKERFIEVVCDVLSPY